MRLQLKNPHSVMATMRKRPGSVERISVTSEAERGPWKEVIETARRERIKVESATRERNHQGSGQPHRSAGSEAWVQALDSVSIEELVANAGQDSEPGLWLALDCLQDPQNVGAIFRSAAFFGVKGILMTADRSTAMTATVYDVASGGVEAVPFAIETNLQRALQICKDVGIWVMGTSEHAEESLFKQKLDRNWLVVIGNEESGLRRLTLENCDLVCTIPASGTGEVTSLNASVAAGVVISQLSR